MSHLPIPLAIVYAGLGGTVLALIVATATNRWSLRVFFLLALRLAIGWHFLFEGLYKVQTYYTGPTETSKPFTSEPYFKVAPGPLGAKMRKEFGDPAAEIALKVKAPKEISPADFAKKTVEEQAAECPEAVAKQFDALQSSAAEALKAEAEKQLKDADADEAKWVKDVDETEQRALKGAWARDDIDRIRATAEDERRKAHTAAAGRREQIRERLAGFEALGAELIAAVKGRPEGDALAKQLEAALKGLADRSNEDLKAVEATEQKALAEADAAEKRALAGQWTDAEKKKIQTKAETDRKLAKERAELNRQAARKKLETVNDLVPKRLLAAKAAYARWVFGVDPRDCKVKGITGDVPLSGPKRIEHVEWLRHQAKEAEDRETNGLGNGYGTDIKRVAEFRMDALTAESDLARDANAFITELKKELNGGKAPEEPAAEEPRGKFLDRVTMWFLVVVGAFLMGGLFTRVSCVLAAGFLVMTYLAHPPFPWYPLPPNTEGNPVFVNKNVIEALALLALAMYPTGRWLGLDAIVLHPPCKYKGEQPVA
ncbi:MAG: hypothetical protein J0I06_28720 [Planctomycetes bacterium]|nr:hypothetical protein [Planctomycetota bacterium]